ncbi:MAG: DUF11 domain-containing protein [Verrucomicrobiales bacterium]|nr:DUF11 domain-containing protein [Verrucomicrobiales bacterium]
MNRRNQFVLGMLLFLLPFGLRAQLLGIDFSARPAPARVSERVVYTLVVNNDAGLTLTNLAVQVELAGNVGLTASSTTQGTATNATQFASYLIPFFTNLTQVTLTYSGFPTDHGVVTHSVTASLLGVAVQVASFTSTNIGGVAQLEIVSTALPRGVVAGDLVDFMLAVTNRGPDRAVDVEVLETIPSGVGYVGVSPAGIYRTLKDGILQLKLGEMEVGGGMLIGLSIQPTSIGTFPLRATVKAPGYDNPKPALSTNVTSVTAAGASAADFRIGVLSPQEYNPQTGLLEQRIGLTNRGSVSIPAARVMVGGLTNWLYNATGTNQSTPFVSYPARLDPGQGVEFVLQYFSSSRQPGPEPSFSAVSVPVPTYPAPVGAGISGVRVRRWVDGSSMIEFPAVEGQRYAIRYASTPAFTNAVTIEPSIVAPASWVQWLDQGPPATLKLPGEAGSRYYRVYHVPTP